VLEQQSQDMSRAMKMEREWIASLGPIPDECDDPTSLFRVSDAVAKWSHIVIPHRTGNDNYYVDNDDS
jgi:hypothetical protein